MLYCLSKILATENFSHINMINQKTNRKELLKIYKLALPSNQFHKPPNLD